MTRSMFTSLIVAAVLTAKVFATVPVWAQCGGSGYSGDTVCSTGNSCVVVNQYYYQCQPGGTSSSSTVSVPSSTPSTPSSTSSAPSPSTSAHKFKYFGVNEAGAEFGSDVWPGVLGTHYTWPEPSSIDYFIGQGFNTFRIAFLMERLNPPATGLTGPFDSAYLNGLKTSVQYVTNKGGYAIIDPHNFMIYNKANIASQSTFQTWWKNLANEFKSNPKVIFDVMNEPNQIPASTAFGLNQAAITGIRSSGATQLILVEGTSWSGAHSWISSGNADAFRYISDPLNNIAIEMHQYLDSDSSGTNPTCVSATIGAERIAAATEWLKTTGFKGFLGEMGAGSNDACVSAVKGALTNMQASGVWIGMTWWSAGPWWANYFTSIEPSSGASISRIMPLLKTFL